MILGQTIPPQLEAGEQEISPNLVKYKTKTCFSYWRAWDYNPQVGLVMAGSQNPRTRNVEMSQDGGKNFTDLPMLPGRNQYGACLVIIDDETVFYAGGINSKKNYVNIFVKNTSFLLFILLLQTRLEFMQIQPFLI